MWTARSRSVVALMAAGALAVGLAACGESLRDEQAGGGSETKKTASGDRPIKMAGVFCVCFVGPYVAWKKGFFEQEGVPVDEFITTKGGSDTFTALQSGDVDFGLS